MKKILIYAAVFLAWPSIASKVLIITHHYMRPDFIELQYKTFKKFISDEYEFVVFNDAKTPALERAINNMCQRLGIECFRISPSIHMRPYLKREPGEDYNHACVRCANVVQYSLDVLGFAHPGPVVIIDSDMFLIRPFSFEGFLKDASLAAVFHSRHNAHTSVEYMWNGLVIFDMPALPQKESINFNCGCIDGVGLDVGGYTSLYLKKYPELKKKRLGALHNERMLCKDCAKDHDYRCTHNTAHLKALGFNENELEFIQSGPPNIEFLLNNSILHYRGGGNWDCKSTEYHRSKTEILNTFMTKVLD